MATVLISPATTGLGITFRPQHNERHASISRLHRNNLRKAHQSRQRSFFTVALNHPNLDHSLPDQSLTTQQDRNKMVVTNNSASSASKMSEIPSGIPGPNISVVDNPIFKILYSESENLLHFSNSKCPLPQALARTNRDLMKWVANRETGTKVDYEMIQKSLQRLSHEPNLQSQSPGVFRFFNWLAQLHTRYCETGALFASFDIWMRMIEAYYSPTGDIQFVSLFPVKDAMGMQTFLNEASIRMSPEAIRIRQTEWTRLHEQWLTTERWLREQKEGEFYTKRLDQLHKLNNIYDYCYGDKSQSQTITFQQRCRARLEHNILRREKRAAIRLANQSQARHQLGTEGQETMPSGQATQLAANNDTLTDRYIADTLPDALKQVNLEEYPDTMGKMSAHESG